MYPNHIKTKELLYSFLPNFYTKTIKNKVLPEYVFMLITFSITVFFVAVFLKNLSSIPIIPWNFKLSTHLKDEFNSARMLKSCTVGDSGVLGFLLLKKQNCGRQKSLRETTHTQSEK